MPSFLKSIFKPSHTPTHSPYRVSNVNVRERESFDESYGEGQDSRRRSSDMTIPDGRVSLTQTQADGDVLRGRRDTLEDLLRTEFRSKNPSLYSIQEEEGQSESGSASGYDKDTLSSLIDTLKSRQSSKSHKSADREGDEKDQRTIKKLMRALENIEMENHPTSSQYRKPQLHKGKEKGKEKRQSSASYSDPALEESKLLKPVIKICSKAIAYGEALLSRGKGRGPNDHLLSRVIALLEAQRDELRDIAPYTGRRRYPALVTLEHIYEKVQVGLKDIRGMLEGNARDSLFGLIQVLQEGPDYLIDIILITSIIHQSSIISIAFSNEIRGILDQSLINQQSKYGNDLNEFKKVTENIIGIASAINRDLLEDRESEGAYKTIGVLVKHLQARTSSSALPTPISSLRGSRSISFSSSSKTPTPLTLPNSPSISPIPSMSSSISSSPTPTRFNSMTTSELQKQFGTGITQSTSTPLPGLSSYNPTPSASRQASSSKPTSKPTSQGTGDDDEDDEDDDEEIWEYRGQLLTASALDLVLREGMLLQADSSNQYAGEVSWDDLRKCWIPKHVQKLKESDLTREDDGELPDTTPAGFKIKEEDEWGNKIGWYDNGSGVKEMYYLEDPRFELPDDDD